MIKYITVLIGFLSLHIHIVAQPGYVLAPLNFRVFYNGEDATQHGVNTFVLEWKNRNSWHKATIQNNAFITGNVETGSSTEIKIYRNGGGDTMFINTTTSLNYIPFQPGHFIINQHTAPLANMKSFAGVNIVNQQWKNFIKPDKDLPLLQRQRYVYMDKAFYPYDIEDENDNAVQYKEFNNSKHISILKDEGYKVNVELGQLYYAPGLSASVYSVGYKNDVDEEERDYRPCLLESQDGCRSWQVLFSMEETDATLANITESGFVFVRNKETISYVVYNRLGNVIDSFATEEPCLPGNNIFSSCDADIKFSNIQGVETSSPLMDNHYMHIFNRVFTNDGVHYVSIDVLPFYPNEISRMEKNGHKEKILELNAKDTYAYLTMRKNKLVLLSYHYTLVSKDFGKTWMYYRNGLLDGGNWNFIWLNDNTLVNVTQEHADVINID